MEEIALEDSKDSDNNLVMVVPDTPVKPKQSLKFYVRRKPIKLLNKRQDINDENKLEEKCLSPPDCGIEIIKGIDESEIIQGTNSFQSSVAEGGDSQSGDGKGETNSKETLKEKQEESGIPQNNSQFVQEKEKNKKNSKVKTTKQRFHRPRIMEVGKEPRDPATTRLRTITRKRKKEKDTEEEVVPEPETPEKQSEKQSFPKKRKNEKTKRNVVRSMTFDQESVLTCLELSRISGPNFPNGRKRMATRRRSIWKNKSRRSSRKRNVDRWARIALSEWLTETLPLVASHLKNKRLSSQTDVSVRLQIEAPKPDSLHSKRKKKTKDIVEPLVQQTCHEKYIGISSPADVPLRIEDTSMRTTSCVVLKRCCEKNKNLNRCSRKTKDNGKPLSKEVSIEKESVADGSLRMQDTCSYVDPKPHNKRTKACIMDNLIQQMIYQRDHNLSSLADVPLHIEDTLMRSPSNLVPEQPIKQAKFITKLIKDMTRLKINQGVTSVMKSRKKKKNMELVTAKVDLDPETIKEWEFLMVNDDPSSRSYDDEETESKWKGEREIFQSRIELFINRMHLLQGNRKFKLWKGSVVDSVVGVFLTQNVCDFLSSNAFMSVAAKFPVDGTESLGIENCKEEHLKVNDLVVDNQGPTSIGNTDAKSSEFISLSEGLIPEVEEVEQTAKRKNEKTGIVEDEKVDWESFRRMYKKEGCRDVMHMDSVDWNAVRLAGQHVFATTIKKRGQFRILSGRILKFLNDETKQNGTADLEWLRNAPSDLVKRYLMDIEGIGLKSAECVRLLGLKHSAFPVDTNVGRIAVRLGWVPLEPLPNGVQMHHLYHYPSMDLIQKYLWPRLCTLPQETLYELHYQMITFGKVFCTKLIPNCNACPMKSECKYFASAYASSKVLLQGPEEKTHETDTSMSTYSYDDDAVISSQINSIEECASPKCNDLTNSFDPLVEFPASPRAETPELVNVEDIPCRSSVEFPASPSTEIPEVIDIEDIGGRSPCQSYAGIPTIDLDMDALKKNVVDALLKGGKMPKNCEDEISKALVVLTPENACIPMKLPKKIKYYNRLRTEHVVYVLPDNHELLRDFDPREPDDPSPYLLAIWQPGETSNSFKPPKKKCNSDGSNLCYIRTCSYCCTIREERSKVFRGTILIPCRTATRGEFPLNGTYFQTNEVFADHETSLNPIIFPRELCDGLEKRALYCGSAVMAIFRLLDTRRIQLCFWTGFLCMRAIDRKSRNPEELVRRLHTPPDERGKKHMQYE